MLSPKTRAIVWARAAGRCQFPGCNKHLIGDLVSNNEDGNFGFIAHIVAEKPGGPRGDLIRSPKLVDEPTNLMLLCHIHHKLIDVDEVDNYPEQRLLDIKAAHEQRIEIVSGITADRATHILRYGARIGDHQSPVSSSKVMNAIIPHRHPADRGTIGIEILGNAQTDAEDTFWPNEVANLRRQFANKVHAEIEGRRIDHLSVFGLAPMPLLVELGSLLGDITPADVYQLHREPSGWQWAEDGPRMSFKIEEPRNKTGAVALKLGISATITDDRIFNVLGREAAIWSVSVENPGNDVMRFKADLQEWRRLLRGLLERIKASSPPDSTIHVFPAIPVSTAIELGRVRMPKADLPFLVYDQVKDRGFVPRLEIK